MDTARRPAQRVRRDRRGITVEDVSAPGANRGNGRAMRVADARMGGATRGENSLTAEASRPKCSHAHSPVCELSERQDNLALRLCSAIVKATDYDVLFVALNLQS